jgi:hypothetical protein
MEAQLTSEDTAIRARAVLLLAEVRALVVAPLCNDARR